MAASARRTGPRNSSSPSTRRRRSRGPATPSPTIMVNGITCRWTAWSNEERRAARIAGPDKLPRTTTDRDRVAELGNRRLSGGWEVGDRERETFRTRSRNPGRTIVKRAGHRPPTARGAVPTSSLPRPVRRLPSTKMAAGRGEPKSVLIAAKPPGGRHHRGGPAQETSFLARV